MKKLIFALFAAMAAVCACCVRVEDSSEFVKVDNGQFER